ncbi:hypothetical protein D3C72_2572720 [compost metagenome]
MTRANPDAALRHYKAAVEAGLDEAQMPLSELCAAAQDGTVELLPVSIDLYCE